MFPHYTEAVPNSKQIVSNMKLMKRNERSSNVMYKKGQVHRNKMYEILLNNCFQKQQLQFF